MVDRFFRYRSFYLIFLCLTIIIILAAWIVTQRTSLMHTSHHPRLYDNKLPLSGNAHISQNFEAKYPGLYRIDIYFENQGIQNNHTVNFHLKQSCDNLEDVETFTVSQSAIVDKEFYPFVFDHPLDDSANKSYCLILDTNNLKKSDQVSVYAGLSDTYLEGEASYQEDTITKIIDNESNNSIVSAKYKVWLPLIINQTQKYQAQSDIAFQLYYQGKVVDTSKTLLAQLASQKPFLFGTIGFYLIIFGVYIVLVIALWYLVFKEEFQ